METNTDRNNPSRAYNQAAIGCCWTEGWAIAGFAPPVALLNAVALPYDSRYAPPTQSMTVMGGYLGAVPSSRQFGRQWIS